MPGERLLVIDDDHAQREVLTHLFTRARYQVRTAPSGEAGLALFDSWDPDLVLSDLTMPGISGLEVLKLIKARAAEQERDVPVILITAFSTVASAVEAMREGAFDYVAKPFLTEELRLVVERALEMRRLAQDNARMRRELSERYQLGGFVGTSPRMSAVYDIVRRVMATRISVLILGESGTGKELLARSIHYGSDRASEPFVPVNCGAISESLWESELFGYRKGAFTGAMKDKVGFFAAANGGTLFLDEVGEMPLGAQVKLLRALSERKVTPVGGTQEEVIDVRVLSATNRNLLAEVRAGRFREDLYYRLNVVQVEMPPLRDRPGDIPELVRHFIDKFGNEYGKRVGGATGEAMSLLQAYPYPGNVRELQNILERAVALEAGPLVTPASLPERVQGALAAPMDDAPATEEMFNPKAGSIDLEGRLAAVERMYIERALKATRGNRTKAAELLGVTFRSFRYRLRKFGMDPGDEAEGG